MKNGHELLVTAVCTAAPVSSMNDNLKFSPTKFVRQEHMTFGVEKSTSDDEADSARTARYPVKHDVKTSKMVSNLRCQGGSINLSLSRMNHLVDTVHNHLKAPPSPIYLWKQEG